jgi:hypothetical protein
VVLFCRQRLATRNQHYDQRFLASRRGGEIG